MAVEEKVLKSGARNSNRRLDDDTVVSKIVELGCACSTDLAGQIGGGVKPGDLNPVLKSLADRGVLRRRALDKTASEADEDHVVYELAR